MRWFVGASLRFRWLVVFAAAAMTAFGIAQIRNARVDVFPEFAPPRVEIQTAALGNSSNEVEELITVPIEEQLNGLPDLEQLRSKSVAQLSSIELVFKRGTDELRGAAAGGGAARPGRANAAELGGAAVHDARRCRRPVES